MRGRAAGVAGAGPQVSWSPLAGSLLTANTLNNIERVYNGAISFSSRRCSVPVESMLPTSILCTVIISKRTTFT